MGRTLSYGSMCVRERINESTHQVLCLDSIHAVEYCIWKYQKAPIFFGSNSCIWRCSWINAVCKPNLLLARGIFWIINDLYYLQSLYICSFPYTYRKPDIGFLPTRWFWILELSIFLCLKFRFMRFNSLNFSFIQVIYVKVYMK